MSGHVEAINVKVGEHHEWHIGGITLHGDTIVATLIAGAVIIVLGLLLRRSYSHRQPGRLGVFFETVNAQVEDQVESTMGIKTAPFVVPLAMTLFLFILIAIVSAPGWPVMGEWLVRRFARRGEHSIRRDRA